MNISKSIKIRAIFAGIVIAICLLGIMIPRPTNADLTSPVSASYVARQTNQALKRIAVKITAYSSEIGQTDSTPFITASGKDVKDGVIANNMLPFGTKIRIPALYGNKVFTVEDRMASYKSNYHVDVWMPSTPLAINFGVKTTEIEILEN